MKGKRKKKDVGVVGRLRPIGKEIDRKETCTHTHIVRKGDVCRVAFMESSTRI